MNRTYKYRLDPTPEQEKNLDFLLWQARRVYNMALEQRIKIYAEQKNTINSMDQWAYFRDLRQAEPDGLGKLNANTMNQVLRNIDKSFQAFFRRIKTGKATGEKPGFPRFKSSNRFKSIILKPGNGCSFQNNDREQMFLYVMNVGEIKIIYHRAIPDGSKVKQAVVKRFNGRWYVNMILEISEVKKEHTKPRSSVGIDIGLKSVIALSNRKVIEHPHWFEKSLRKLRVLCRKADRQKKGSKRQSATYRQIAKLYEHIANQRSDFYHKLSRDISSKYAIIGIENLNLTFMNRNKKTSRTSYDAGLGTFRQMLLYKAEEAGGRVIAVNPAFTTQKCSRCGYKAKKSLSVRVHKCPECGLKLDRDVNAAKNILKLARAKLLAVSSQALK